MVSADKTIRRLCVIIALAVAAASMSACGAPKRARTSATSNTPTTTQAAPTTDEPSCTSATDEAVSQLEEVMQLFDDGERSEAFDVIREIDPSAMVESVGQACGEAGAGAAHSRLIVTLNADLPSRSRDTQDFVGGLMREICTIDTATGLDPEASAICTIMTAPTTTAPPTTAAPSTTAAPPTTQDPRANETVSQRNARQKAADYLEFMAFSRSGLIKQLEYEGFSNSDATYGVDALNVDWYEQAAKKAADYLEFMSFSRSGLIDQLLYEGFTQAEAEYGVSTTGL